MMFMLLIVMLCVVCYEFEQATFKLTIGFRLHRGTQLKMIYRKSMTPTFCSMMCTPECGSATYSTKNNTCITLRDKFYNSTVAWIKDTDWNVVFRNEPIQYDAWTMVFRAQKEINAFLYTVWKAKGRHDDSPLSSGTLNGCYRLDNMGNCTQHFRSSILDNWTNIKQVKFSLNVNGSEVNNIIFNGASSNVTNWFEQSKIVSSSWSNMVEDPQIGDFQIDGAFAGTNDFLLLKLSFAPMTAFNCLRRFIIWGPYGGCSTDSAYIMAVDSGHEGCMGVWPLSLNKYPVFIYSKQSGPATLSKSMEWGYADVMALFVKF